MTENPAGFSLFFTPKWVKNTTFHIDIGSKRNNEVSAALATTLITVLSISDLQSLEQRLPPGGRLTGIVLLPGRRAAAHIFSLVFTDIIKTYLRLKVTIMCPHYIFLPTKQRTHNLHGTVVPNLVGFNTMNLFFKLLRPTP